MPRESIGSSLVEGRLTVTVGWGTNAYVQIATVSQELELNDPNRGWWVDVSRDEINRLIKVLRKARDQAYGADE